MTDGYIGGWRRDREDWDLLESIEDDRPVLQLVGNYVEQTLDPREVLKVENQRNQGACQGHAITSVCEWVHAIATGQPGLQLSRAMGYYESQRLDRINGDRGSTISAGVKLSRNTGICEEQLWPYPSRYSPGRPGGWQAITENAAKYRVGSEYRLTSYDAIRTFLGSGQGGVSIGISWGRGMSASVLERHSGGGGGHAIALLALSERKDSQGRPYIWMMNSWGESWGNRGWAEWSPRAVMQMCSDRFTVAIGLSDMPHCKPREFNLEDWKRELSVT